MKVGFLVLPSRIDCLTPMQVDRIVSHDGRQLDDASWQWKLSRYKYPLCFFLFYLFFLNLSQLGASIDLFPINFFLVHPTLHLAMNNHATPYSSDGDGELTTHPYTLFKDHCTGKNNESQLVVMEAIRATHPDMHVTTFYQNDFDLFGWAKSQKAQVTLLPCGNHHLIQRQYEVSEHQLCDRIVFGHYRLNLEEKSFEFYKAEWREVFGRLKQVFYLLSEKTDVDEAGPHSKPADDLLMKIGKWTSQLHDEIYVFDGGDWNKDERLWKAIMSSNWDDVILDPLMKHSLIDDVHGFFDSEAMHREYSIPWKRGIIFHGTPGCGKTMTIKALMRSLDERQDAISSLVVKSFRACDGPEEGIGRIFNLARHMTPCLLVFEDLDSMVVEKVRSYFLNQVDGLESNDGILMIASTNHLERLDSGISKRPSRFDRKYHFDLPSEAGRVRYCEYWRAKLSTTKANFDREMTEVIARMTEEFSYAYLKELFVQSLLIVARANENNDYIQKTSSARRTIEDGIMVEEDIPEKFLANRFMRTLRVQAAALRIDLNEVEETKPGKRESENESDG